MALDIDSAAQSCQQIAREIRDDQKPLTVQFICHYEGRRKEAFAMIGQEILSHPAAETAMHFLRKQERSEESALLGTAVARQNMFLGLTARNSVLALCSINLDHFENIKAVRRQAYHLAWHALDTFQYHSKNMNSKGGGHELILRRRNTLELARANLEADIFSAAMSAFSRDKEAPRRIASRRAMAALQTRALSKPEFYPYAIAMEATECALNRTNVDHISKKRKFMTAQKIAQHVSLTFRDIHLKYWLAFAEPAQDMSWRGFGPEDVISAAINTSRNSHIRVLGYLVSEITGIRPTSVLDIVHNYSPFADNAFNEELHDKIVDQIFQDVIAQGLRQNSSSPFAAMAHQQNSALTEGKMIGWCASALQASGKAYDLAREGGDEAENRMREEFESKRYTTQWADLKELGKRIIRQQRQGNAVTMKDIEDLAKDMKSLKTLRQSVAKTMNDPHYKQKLAAANELAAARNFEPAQPATGTPSLKAVPAAPAAAHSLSIPGLGGATKQPPPVENHQKDTTGRQE